MPLNTTADGSSTNPIILIVSTDDEMNDAIDTIANGSNDKYYEVRVSGNVDLPALNFKPATDITVTITGGGTLTMETGSSISGNTVTSPNRDGAGVYVDVGGKFIMNDGSIFNNSVTGDTSLTLNNGAGVFVNGTFEMNGGSIYNNTANMGGSVYVAAAGTFDGDVVDDYYTGGSDWEDHIYGNFPAGNDAEAP